MVKIIKADDGTSLGMTEALTYIKQADNGCYILCPEQDASGISYAGNVYHLLGRDGMDDVDTVALEQVDTGALLAANIQAITDADEVNVDQEYRLTILELGVSDDTTATE